VINDPSSIRVFIIHSNLHGLDSFFWDYPSYLRTGKKFYKSFRHSTEEYTLTKPCNYDVACYLKEDFLQIRKNSGFHISIVTGFFVHGRYYPCFDLPMESGRNLSLLFFIFAFSNIAPLAPLPFFPSPRDNGVRRKPGGRNRGER
jgi:hypothetical protein